MLVIHEVGDYSPGVPGLVCAGLPQGGVEEKTSSPHRSSGQHLSDVSSLKNNN